jgi:hypothetical protein
VLVHGSRLDAICDDLADRIGARWAEVAGHEIQFTGEPINQQLRSLWSGG